MKAVFRSVCVALSLLSAAALCFSQSAEDKQASLAAHLQKAQEYLSQKRPDLAIPELEAAAAIDPGNVETQGNLGVLLYFQGRLADAVRHLRAAVDRQQGDGPGMAKIQGLLGLAELRTLDYAEGRKDLEIAFPLIQEKNFKVQVGLELVSAYTATGDLDQAATVLAQLRKTAPDDPEVLYAAYRTYRDLSGEAMLALSLAAADSAQMHQVLAHEEVRQGNTNAAIAEFRKAIAINPQLPGIHFELAEVLHTSQNEAVKQEAEREYRAALAENPQDEKAICRLAEIDAQKGNSERAYEEYSKAVELQPADADAKIGLAKSLIEMNQNDKALALLEETVKLEPTNATAHYRLSALYRNMGRMDDARREVETYKQLKETKDKLRAVYKELQVQPEEIRANEQDEQ